MKTIIKNILLASLAFVSFGINNLHAIRRGNNSAVAFQPVVTTEEERITSLESAYAAYTKLINDTSAHSTLNFHEELLGFGQQESDLKNPTLSREQQLIQYQNLTKVVTELKNRISQEKSKHNGDTTTKTTFEDQLKERAIKLLNQIAFNQEQWKTLNKNINEYADCTKKDEGIRDRMDQKIAQDDNFSVKAGLDVTDETPNETFVKKWLANVAQWRAIESALRNPKLTDKEIKELIVEPLTQTALKAYVASGKLKQSKTKADITSVQALKDYLKDQQLAHTMNLECSLEQKNMLFLNYKTLGFAAEAEGISIRKSLKTIGIPVVVLAAIGAFIFAGEKNYLPTTKFIPTGTADSDPKKSIQTLYDEGKKLITGFFKPSTTGSTV